MTEDSFIFPTSYAQQRLWFLDQLEPGGAVYILSRAWRVAGALRYEALQQAVTALVDRHESLRTTFAAVDGRPMQIVAARQQVWVSRIDLRGLTLPEREAARRLATEAALRPFDLARGPLFRVALIDLDAAEHMLVISIHHIISDGWSMDVLFRELSELYNSFRAGRPARLAALPIQYADFAAWQREWLDGAGDHAGSPLQAHLSYWRERLAGAAAALELPTDRRRPAIQSFNGAIHKFGLPAPLASALRALSRREQATLFMTVLAAFQILLHRYSGQADILVGAPIANRRQVELEGLIGFFVNTLVLRADLSGSPTFRELLAQVRETCLGAYAHQDLPFEQLVEALQPERDLSRNPLFQVMFDLRSDASTGELQLDGLTLHPLALDNTAAAFDLMLSMQDTAAGLTGWVEYNTDLFDAATIERMVGHFQTLLEQLAADPEQRIDELSPLTQAERLMLREWNRTQAAYPQDICIHHLFEAQAERTPGAEAVVFGKQRLTYRELNDRANQLAHHLRSLGVGPEVAVGLCVERSLELAVGLLGILKAGGAYVPLDPAYPPERLAWMLEDARVSVLLTAASGDKETRRQADKETRRLLELNVSPSPLLPFSPSHDQWSVVDLVADWPLIAQRPTESPSSGVRSENLAYVIYTSGSTGRPKGVLVTHRGLINHCAAITRQFELRPGDRVLQFASISFDIAAEELYPSWAAGAAVVLRPDDAPPAAADFVRAIEEQQITIVNLPAAYWHTWVHELASAPAPARLRLVVVGNERVAPAALAAWSRADTRHVRWLNAYGPTETTITATLYEPPAGAAHDAEREVPIGRPIANLQAHILDQHLRPVGVGLPGELYIAGDGVARGYLNRPELTAERFIPNPFADFGFTPTGYPILDFGLGNLQNPKSKIQNRLYRTGDLARYRPDGSIEFLGRADQQVKVRGYRIELGEVESALAQHPAVREAVVVAREDVSGERRLVAYVVPAAEDRGLKIEDSNPGASEMLSSILYPPSSLVGELRAFLKERLPGYMVPSAIVRLDAIPLTPNGKLDRRALPAPDAPGAAGDASAMAPRTSIEHALAETWRAVLGLGQVGVHDNFFALGGDSLTAIRVVARANQQGLGITTKQLFQNQTIAQLAAVAGTAGIQAEQGAVIGAVGFTPAQLHFLASNPPNPQRHSIGYLLEAGERLDFALLERAARSLQSHHDALRLRLLRADQGWRLIGAGPAEPVALSRVDLSELAEEQIDAAIESTFGELQRRFDLANGPLWQLCLLHFGSRKPDHLILVGHCLALDLVSLQIVLADLDLAYQQLSRGEPLGAQSYLPAKTTSLKAWAERLARHAQSAEIRQELGEWLAEERRRVAPLPVDYPRGANVAGSHDSVSVWLGHEQSQALVREVSRNPALRIDDLLLTAMLQTLGEWAGGQALLVNMIGHGREGLFDDIDLSRTVGGMGTVFPAYFDLQAAARSGDAVRSCGQQLRRVPNRGIGYGVLRYLSGDESLVEQLEAMPRADIAFNYTGLPVPSLSMFRPVRPFVGYFEDHDAIRPHLLQLTAGFTGDGRLQMSWDYSQNLHRRSTIETLADRCLQTLRSLLG